MLYIDLIQVLISRQINKASRDKEVQSMHNRRGTKYASNIDKTYFMLNLWSNMAVLQRW